MKISLCLLLLPLFINGQDFPQKPTNYVTSFDPFYLKNSVFSKEEEESLNVKLRAFEDSTGIRLFIYTTLKGPIHDKEALAQKIFRTWGMEHNGTLIAIFTADEKFVVAGNGLDAILSFDSYMQILDVEMKPHFEAKNFYKGIDAGIDKLIYYSAHQYEPPGILEKINKNKMEIIGGSALLLPFIIALLYKAKRRT